MPIIDAKNKSELVKAYTANRGPLEVVSICFKNHVDVIAKEFIVLGMRNNLAVSVWSDKRVYADFKVFVNKVLDEDSNLFIVPADKSPFFRPIIGKDKVEWTATLNGYSLQTYLDEIEMDSDDFFTGEWDESFLPLVVEPPVQPTKKTQKKS